MIQYLKPQSYYEDIYDLMTVKDCLWTVNYFQNKYRELIKKGKKIDPDEKKALYIALEMDLYYRKGEKYKNRQSNINERIEQDRVRQEKLDNTEPPSNISCPKCDHEMSDTYKTLDDITENPLRVLFFFECPKCKKRIGIYDNGEVHKSKPHNCPKCKQIASYTPFKKGKEIIWTTKCESCGYLNKEKDDYEEWHQKRIKEEEEDRKLLNKYRKEFCITEEEGQKYIEYTNRMKILKEIIDKEQQKKTDPVYQKVIKLKKFTVIELEKLLSRVLEKEKYIKLSLDKPIFEKQVIVPFTIQDSDSNRKEYDSVHKLQKIIKKTLEETNWRLMSEGVIYRLGYLSGRLKGYEGEEDLVQLLKRD